MLQAFSTLIAAFSALLATPGFLTNPVIQNQAMALVPQIQSVAAEIQIITPTSTPPITPMGGADIISTQTPPTQPAPVAQTTPAPTPSCTASAIKNDDGSVSLSWTSEGISQPGKLSVDRIYDGGRVIYQDIETSLPTSGTESSLQWKTVYKISFGNVACFTFFPDRNTQTSTPNPPDSWSQITF